MGAVKEIEDYSMLISLPNGLTGQIKLADVTSYYVDYLKQQADAAEQSDESEEEKEEEDDVKTLRDLFSIGQQVSVWSRRRLDSSRKQQEKEKLLSEYPSSNLFFGLD